MGSIAGFVEAAPLLAAMLANCGEGVHFSIAPRPAAD
jgi:hypothetical protein